MDKREFWSTKPRDPRFDTVTFEHPEFDAPFRLVCNVFASVTLGGNVYTPAPMAIKFPDQTSDVQPRMLITFPRQVVGRQFKQQLRLIQAAGSLDPITVTGSIWLKDTDAPKVTWELYASDQGGIGFDADYVQVSATLDNPMRRRVAPVYDVDTFTGLQAV